LWRRTPLSECAFEIAGTNQHTLDRR